MNSFRNGERDGEDPTVSNFSLPEAQLRSPKSRGLYNRVCNLASSFKDLQLQKSFSRKEEASWLGAPGRAILTLTVGDNWSGSVYGYQGEVRTSPLSNDQALLCLALVYVHILAIVTLDADQR